jgi:cytidine deaminase
MGVMDFEVLLSAARDVRERAYAPYSAFLVGAAVMGASGRIYVGCNVENATYGATICAERAAVCSMVANGESRLVAVAVYTEAERAATPCGICRQVLAEFAHDATVIVANKSGQATYSLAQLLPERFVLGPNGDRNG